MIIVMTKTKQPTFPIIQVTRLRWITLMTLGLYSITPRDSAHRTSPTAGHSRGQPLSRGIPLFGTYELLI